MNVIERIDKMIAAAEICGAHTVSLTQSEVMELLRLARIGAAMQWITVSERLPEEENVVLVWVGTTCGRACIGKTPYGQAWYLVDQHCYLNMYNVTHWMPLPVAPVKDGAE